MLRVAFLAILAAAALSVGCATFTVSSHVERGVNFAEFVTYDWGPPDNLPVGDPRLDNNPFFRDYLMGAVEKELERRGYRRVTDVPPQLLIRYHANVAHRFEVHGIEPKNYPNCTPNCEPAVVQYDEGTIIVDVVNAATGTVIWRAWAQDNVSGLIDNQEALQRHVQRSVGKMFEEYPAR